MNGGSADSTVLGQCLSLWHPAEIIVWSNLSDKMEQMYCIAVEIDRQYTEVPDLLDSPRGNVPGEEVGEQQIERLPAMGLTEDHLKADDWIETQVLGELVREAGFEGMIVPSAAGDFQNLVIFMDRLSPESSVQLGLVKPLLRS